jgi:nucleoside-specific outer membrane channel protein Tsx
MTTKNFVRAAVALAAVATAHSAFAADWSDTSIGYRYGTKFQEPFNGRDITKHIVNLTHVSGSKSGSDFFNVDLLKSDATDSNAQEAYVVYRHTFDLGYYLHREIKYGPVKAWGLTAGFDWNTKNDPGYGSKKHMLVLGPTASLDVPGFLNVGLYAFFESNFPNGIASRYTYDTHPALGASWGIPLGSSGFSYEGYLNWIAAKGKDEFGNGTAPEFNIDSQIMYDASPWVHAAKGKFKVGFEYQYWHNKFGNPSSVPGSTARTPMVRVEYHF